MQIFYNAATYLFDPLHNLWESPRTERVVGGLLTLFFLGALLTIECNRQGWLPPSLASITPTNHFHAVGLAFTLVLVLEVVGLVFTLPCSLSKSVGKQLEILALILLRNAFKELAFFPEPIALESVGPVLPLLASGVGALVIFVLLGFYYRMVQQKSLLKSGVDRYRFVAMKKAVALFLLGLFVVTGAWDMYLHYTHGPAYEFFETFYTVLIFSDILLVLLSQQFLPAFHAIFRNSGYALATVLMRLALTAPHYYDAALGTAAAAFAVLITLAYRYFDPRALADED
ncbi:MAG: hypothetical protein H0S85_13795 [Desulfovibrionaceae bacterium]|jgi:hypothetical protein|nr:hypothetical protein [Desulfovibrionaceae bacterium]